MNRPSKCVRDDQEKIFRLIDVSIPTDRNISLNEREELSKYKDLDIKVKPKDRKKSQ